MIYEQRIRNAGRLKFLNEETASNGLYRVFIEATNGKGKEISFLAKDIYPMELIKEVDRFMGMVDCSMLKVGGDGKFRTEIRYDNKSSFIAYVHAKTGRVMTSYFTHDDWKGNPINRDDQ